MGTFGVPMVRRCLNGARVSADQIASCLQEMILNMYECLHECLSSFSIAQPIGRHIPNMGMEKT